MTFARHELTMCQLFIFTIGVQISQENAIFCPRDLFAVPPFTRPTSPDPCRSFTTTWHASTSLRRCIEVLDPDQLNSIEHYCKHMNHLTNTMKTSFTSLLLIIHWFKFCNFFKFIFKSLCICTTCLLILSDHLLILYSMPDSLHRRRRKSCDFNEIRFSEDVQKYLLAFRHLGLIT